MARHRQRPERAQVPPVLERDQAERDDDQQHRLLVHVPAKQKRRVAAQRHRPDEGVPRRLQEQLQQRDGLEQQREREAHARRDLGQHREGRVTHQPARHALQRALLDRQPEPRREHDQHAVHERVHGPDVGRPVGVAEPAREGEQTAEDLRDLALERERAERGAEDGRDARAQLEAVEELDAEDGFRREAVGAQEEDEVGRCQVEVDVLHAQQGGEEEAAPE